MAPTVGTVHPDKGNLAWMPMREPNGLYQDAKLAARISGPKVDEARQLVEFDEIYESKRTAASWVGSDR